MFTQLLQATRGLLLLGLLTSAYSAAAQEYYDYYDGKRVELHAATDKLVVKFKNPETALRRSKVQTSLQRLAAAQELQLTSVPGIAFVTLRTSTTKAAALQAIKQLGQDVDIVSSSPVLLTETGEAMGAYTDEVVVALKPGQSKAAMLKLAEGLGATLVRPYEFDAQTFILSVDKNKGTALTVANRLAESGVAKYAQPNYLLYVDKTTSDPYYSQQWAIENTGSNSSPSGVAGADMKVYQAWQATYWNSGNGIKIAVVDEGVDLTHPDLAAALNPGFDATGGGTNGGSVGNSAHGTACAGEIVAIPNNNIGIAGVAYNSKVVPVRVLTPNSTTNDLTVASYCASGLDWAWQNNRSDIISCSWRMAVGQNMIADAIRRAVSSGRNYSGTPLGCVVLFATGNEDANGINFPASMSEVVAVGAASMCDRRKSPASCDGENWWGSNYGTGLDVVAPGVKIYTTDIQGAAGYNLASGAAGDYISNFNGTSSATPYAAAVTSLILCSNSSLTQAQARGILESTANKVGGYTYTPGAGERTDLTWNAEMGYGRINAYDAVLQARACASQSAMNAPDINLASRGTPSPGNAYQYDVRINNVGATSYMLLIEQPDGRGGWTSSGTVTYNAYAGPDNASSNELQGFTTFHTGFIGPTPAPGGGSTGPGATYRFTVTATGPCNSVVAQKAITIPPYAGDYSESTRTASGNLTAAYPNPASETLIIPAGVAEVVLVNDKGKTVRSADASNKLDVQSLPDGLYNLRMKQGDKLINQRIQIKH